MAKVFLRHDLDRPTRRSLKASLSACTVLGLDALAFAHEAKADPASDVQNQYIGDFAGWAPTPGVRVLTGDFNGDGKTDIVLINQSAGGTTIPAALSP